MSNEEKYLGINFVESRGFHPPHPPAQSAPQAEASLIFPKQAGMRVVGVRWGRTMAGDPVILEGIYETEGETFLDTPENLSNQPLMGPGRPVGWEE